ncbi:MULTISPECIES: hypothetical protein [Bacteroidota]|uniref:hypothetical protein n=1 Tax=Bacteroidota TaxID=976 RepID=UPI00328673B4
MPDKKSIVSDPIELRTAQEYFAAFEEEGFLETFKHYTGGIFHAEEMKNWSSKPRFDGIFFWYCWDEDQVYVAAEYRDNFKFDDDLIEQYQPIPSSEIIECTNLIMSSGEKEWNPFLTVFDFEVDVLLGKNKNKASNSVVIQPKVNEFLRQTEGKNLCEVGFAYMSVEDGQDIGRSYLLEFLGNPDLEYISYHFGFDANDSPHGLRLVLIARDAQGKPLQNKIKTSDFKFYMINGSRPPRPR